MPFAAGSIVAGKYRIERVIGEGGMGWVVQATHLQLDQQVALKFMHAAGATDHPQAVARFLREARAAARIQSEHVARVSDVGILETGMPYLVMEYLQGQDLDALIRARAPLPLAEAMQYAVQACEGLAGAHAAGIVHRDLKPANLFLARSADGSVRVKLLDFGISKVSASAGRSSDGAVTGTHNLMGSPLYMAPEQMRSSKHVDRRADIWSMGVIVYEMLSGRPPFQGDTLPEICARILAEPPDTLTLSATRVPAALEAVIARCLEKDPARRCADVATLARALAAFGAPELRISADRIERLLRTGDRVGAPDTGPPPIAPTLAEGSSPVAQTNGSFGAPTVEPKARRSHGAALAVGGLVGATVAVIAFVAPRGGHDVKPIEPSVQLPVATPPTPPPPVGLPLSAPTSPPEPSAALTPLPADLEPKAPEPQAPVHGGSAPAIPPVPDGFAAVHATAKAAPVATPPARPVTKPKPAASGTPKPSSTAAFGGRD
jgi:serine/threonine-protein kinase